MSNTSKKGIVINLRCTESYAAYELERPAFKRSRDFDLYCTTHERLSQTEHELAHTRNLYFVKVVELEQMQREKEQLQKEKEEMESEVKRLREHITNTSWLANEISEARFDCALRDAENMIGFDSWWQ